MDYDILFFLMELALAFFFVFSYSPDEGLLVRQNFPLLQAPG